MRVVMKVMASLVLSLARTRRTAIWAMVVANNSKFKEPNHSSTFPATCRRRLTTLNLLSRSGVVYSAALYAI